MCPRCEGMGKVTDFDLTALYDDTKSLNEGALTIPGYSMDGWYGRIFTAAAASSTPTSRSRLHQEGADDLLYKEPTKIKVDGINLTYEGLIPKIQKSFLSKDVEAMQPHIRAFVERAVTFTTCPECDGTRLNEAARSSKIKGINIADACAMQISDLAAWVRGLDEPSVAPLLKGCSRRSTPSSRSGSATSRLDRPSGTLSGGEAQRTKMIRHLGSSLTDVTYVFDEPTIGLHPHDIAHERAAAAAARQGQHRAGRRAQARGDRHRRPRRRPRPRRRHRGRRDRVRGHGRGAARQRHAHRPPPRRPGQLKDLGAHADRALEIRGATRTTCKDVDVDIPLGVLVVVTGVAGSGKSSLIHGSVPRARGVVSVDQGAIKGSRRSNPATYTGLLEPIRKAFAKANGVKPALFSANSEGACPAATAPA
jgi:excinuclease UvrABC ATPase subunit